MRPPMQTKTPASQYRVPTEIQRTHQVTPRTSVQTRMSTCSEENSPVAQPLVTNPKPPVYWGKTPMRP